MFVGVFRVCSVVLMLVAFSATSAWAIGPGDDMPRTVQIYPPLLSGLGDGGGIRAEWSESSSAYCGRGVAWDPVTLVLSVTAKGSVHYVCTLAGSLAAGWSVSSVSQDDGGWGVDGCRVSPWVSGYSLEALPPFFDMAVASFVWAGVPFMAFVSACSLMGILWMQFHMGMRIFGHRPKV